MSDVALPVGASAKPKLDHPVAPTTAIIFLTVLLAGIGYAALSIYSEVKDAGVTAETSLPFILLGIALLIALGFEFVNGFHDTANAVATVIYTHSLKPNVAVLWSGAWNFLGVLVSSGAVAFVIISLLPVELILEVGSGARGRPIARGRWRGSARSPRAK
jgi:PiT family inorganic phosphate transporter